ncbi:MAG: tetratricopeptide repeat protein, partial [Myxococcales bacterium]|nr:tetratricopeptide repeat protein [Myxococcales bacterium]
ERSGQTDLADDWAERCFDRFHASIACTGIYVQGLQERQGPEAEALTYAALQRLGRGIGGNVPRLRQVEYHLRRELGQSVAVMFLQSVAADRPRNTQIQTMTAWACYRNGEPDLAIEYMTKVLDVRPNSPDALNFIGYTWAERGVNLDQAEQMIMSALDVRPNDGNIQDSLGWVFYMRGDFQSAIEWLELANQNSPGDSVLLEHLGDAYAAAGRTEEAAAVYRRAIEAAGDGGVDHLRDKLEGLDVPSETT